ncbi:MAG: Lin0512 family protein [Pseudomonadota bacterium]
MALKQIILEMGTGNDLHGGDYTKAAKRAVQDALHHSSLALFRALGRNPREMQIELTLAAQAPDAIDVDAVAATLPYGTVTAKAVKGGLDVPDPEHGDVAVIVNAGVRVMLEL